MSGSVCLGERNNQSNYLIWKYEIQCPPQFLVSVSCEEELNFSYVATAEPCINNVSRKKGVSGFEQSPSEF